MPAAAHDVRVLRVIRRVVAMAFVLGGSVWATEATLKNLVVPEFDAGGRMIRRLKAETATGRLIEKSQLKNGVIEFFEASDGGDAQIATLGFKDAAYDQARHTVEGDGRVVLRSAKGDVAGEGFFYDIDRSRLLLKSAVVIDHNDVRVAGNSGEILLAQAPSAKEALIKEATLKGGIVVSGKLDPKLDIEKAESEQAVYTANDEIITLSSPIYIWRKGVKMPAESDSITLYVGKGPRPATKTN